ncbi:MAG: hypothetical protein JWM71_1438, partial [Solirubrobacteraceae bacterium]|nr:hypothetical protein [Solirubrobacteraceae bacterium]
MLARRLTLLLLAAVALIPAGPANAAVPSTTPDAGAWVPNGSIQTAIRRGGETWLAGDFDWWGPWTGSGAGIDVATGATDSGFPVVGGGEILAMTPDTLGGAYIGGDFTTINGQPHPYLAHINSGGSVDPSFNPAPNSDVRAITLSPDAATLYIGGDFTAVDGQTRKNIAALVPLGDTVKAWSSCVNYSSPPIGQSPRIDAITVSADSGTVYAAGQFDEAGSGASCSTATRENLAVFNASTGVPTALAPDPDGEVLALALNGSTLYAGGKFSSLGVNHLTRGLLGAVSTTTGNATSFDPHPDGYINALKVTGTALYVGGGFTTIGTNAAARTGVAALSFAGAATAFDAHLAADPILGYVNVQALALTTGPARLLVGGALATASGTAELASVDAATGAVDPSMDPRPGGPVEAIAATQSGHAFFGGQFNSVGAIRRSGIAELDASGHPTSFSIGGGRQDAVNMALSPDGSKVYAMGFFNGAFSQVAAAWDTSTGALLPWAPAITGGFVDQFAVSPTGDAVYFGGNFSSIDGSPRSDIGAVTASGTGTLLPWRPDADGEVKSLAVSPDGSVVYAGGAFSHIGPAVTTRPFLAGLSSSTGEATSWAPASDGQVTAITPTTDGAHVYVAGLFSHIGASSVARAGIADLTTATANATPFSGELDDYSASTIAVPADESTIFAGGYFRKAFGYDHWGIAAFNGGNGSDASWSPNLSHFNQVVSVTLADATVVLGGWFYSAGPDA